MKAYFQSRITLTLILTLTLAGLLGMNPAPAGATTFVVDTVVDESDGSCADGDCSLRDAINIAAPGDTIVFAADLSGQTIALTIGQLDINRNLTIDGSDLADPVRISGNNTFRVFATHGNMIVTLRGLVIADGQTPSDGLCGGGIYNEADLTVTGCTVTSNTTSCNGGGIRNLGTLTINGGSVISYNQGDYGGGIRNEGTLTIQDSTVSDNTANFGGGIDNYVGSLTMTNSTVERNTAVHAGGGLTTGADAYIEDSAFRNNTADFGGGIDSHEPSGALTLVRCTFEGNTASGDGGGLINSDATVQITGLSLLSRSVSVAGPAQGLGRTGAESLPCRFENNSAGGSGGGIAAYSGVLGITSCAFMSNTATVNGGGIANMGGIVTVTDSTLRENMAGVGGGLYADNSSTTEVRGSTFVGNSATDTTGGGIANGGVSTLTVANSTFSANTAASYGGGIHNQDGVLTLTNVTLAGNSSGGGGGISNSDDGTLNYRNTIVAGSPGGGDCLSSGAIGENIHNLVQDGSCSPLLTGDPRLGPLADNGGPTETHALQPDSPAVDLGDPATCLATDQREEARDDWACDIGAFELKYADSDTVVKAIGEPGVYTFGPTKVKVEVVTQGGLTSLTVTKVVGDHPGRTGGGGGGGGVGWGEYFVLTPNDGANGTFDAALTLPALFTPDPNDKVCRYLGGTAWDCAAHSFGQDPFAYITRQGVTAFSDWAAGNEVGPNAVTVREFRARPWSWIEWVKSVLHK